jgi:hypothetical protein
MLGDIRAILLMREYYKPGDSMAGFQYIENYLGKVEIFQNAENSVRGYLSDNRSSFYKVQQDLANTTT